MENNRYKVEAKMYTETFTYSVYYTSYLHYLGLTYQHHTLYVIKILPSNGKCNGIQKLWWAKLWDQLRRHALDENKSSYNSTFTQSYLYLRLKCFSR